MAKNYFGKHAKSISKIGDGYDCTEFALEVKGVDIEALRAKANEIGTEKDMGNFEELFPHRTNKPTKGIES